MAKLIPRDGPVSESLDPVSVSGLGDSLSPRIALLLRASPRRQERLWVLGRLDNNRHPQTSASDTAVCPSELFGLACAFLWMGCLSMKAQAISRLRTLWCRTA